MINETHDSAHRSWVASAEGFIVCLALVRANPGTWAATTQLRSLISTAKISVLS
jgi:hypothetical protein